MRIGIDARVLTNDAPTGIGICVIEALKFFATQNDNNTYLLFSNTEILDKYDFGQKFQKIIIGSERSSMWVFKELSSNIEKYNIDVFWGPLHLIPNGNGFKKVVTINDLALIINPRWGGFKNAILQNTFVKKSIRQADRIITISESTKNDLIRIMHIDESLIDIAYPGFSKVEKCLKKPSEKIQSLLHSDFILYIGTIEPRKNITNIVRAFNIIKSNCGNFHLVLAGKLGWNYKGILREIKKSPFYNDIHTIGYISESDKDALLRNARLFLFPSYYEGFGIPIIESVQYGTPVITSKISSMPEAGGPDIFYVDDPDNPNQIAEQIINIISLNESDLKDRMEKSLKYIERFTWNKFGASIYSTLMN